MFIVSFNSVDEKNVSVSIAQFLTAYGIIGLLRQCDSLPTGFALFQKFHIQAT